MIDDTVLNLNLNSNIEIHKYITMMNLYNQF